MDEKKIVEYILRNDITKIAKQECDLEKIFRDIKVIRKEEKEGISPSVQMFASIREDQFRELFADYIIRKGTEDVFVKIGFSSPSDNGLEVEHSIYSYLSGLLLYNRTPNIMSYAGSFVCPSFKKYLKYLSDKKGDDKDVKELIKQAHNIEISKPTINIDTAYILVLEKGNGAEFYKCLENKEFTRKEFLQVLFQIFYTIHQLHKANINHNDLHLGNIWIDIHPTPISMVYFVSDTIYYKMETRFIVKLFDFDKSFFTIDSIKNKMAALFCSTYGVCTKNDERRDIYKVVASLYPASAKDEGSVSDLFIKTIVESIVVNKKYLSPECISSRPDLHGKGLCEFIGIPCSRLPDGSCDPNFVIPEGHILNFIEICNKTLMFDWMRYSLTNDGYSFNDLPLTRDVLATDIPSRDFQRRVYFSLDCTKSPLEFADILRRVQRGEKKVGKLDIQIPETRPLILPRTFSFKDLSESLSDDFMDVD